jgi:hypothetical protein
MQDQDVQLDQLLDIITRQKNIGSAIGNELELQIDLIEEAENILENTNNRMDRANNNLMNLFDKGDSNSIFYFNSSRLYRLFTDYYPSFLHILLEMIEYIILNYNQGIDLDEISSEYEDFSHFSLKQMKKNDTLLESVTNSFPTGT